MAKLIVGDLEFEWLVSDKRKHPAVVVDRDGSLQVRSSPQETQDDLIRLIESKRLSIYMKLAQKGKLLKPKSEKEYVEGEGFSYLGRSYRLSLVDAGDAPLVFDRGRFFLDKNCISSAKELFIQWYTQQGKKHIPALIRRYSSRLGEKPAGYKIQELGYRWASCGKDRYLYFHWKTLMLPLSIVEYLVAHETSHLREMNHSPEFWRILSSLLPDYQERKRWLAENGAGIGL